MDRAGLIFLGKIFIVEVFCVILAVWLTQVTKEWVWANGIVDSWGLLKGSPAGLAFNLCWTVGLMVIFGVLLWKERQQGIKEQSDGQ